MRKILAILLVGIFVVAIPSASSMTGPRIGRGIIPNTPIRTADVPEWADGNITGVYAAGDITGGLRQVVTACAEGAIAALNSTEAVGKKYPY